MSLRKLNSSLGVKIKNLLILETSSKQGLPKLIPVLFTVTKFLVLLLTLLLLTIFLKVEVRAFSMSKS